MWLMQLINFIDHYSFTILVVLFVGIICQLASHAFTQEEEDYDRDNDI